MIQLYLPEELLFSTLGWATKSRFSPFSPTRAHLDRVKGEEVVEACPEDYVMTAGASKGLVGVLILPLLVLHHLLYHLHLHHLY